jgi:PAS domain S-box-containing protein
MFRFLKKVPLRISLIYCLSSILWILFSDNLLFFLQTEGMMGKHQVFHTAKGLFFVAVTGILLYVLIKGLVSSLLASEKQYRLMFEDNPNPMWVYDLQTLKFIGVNTAAIKHYGYTKEEFGRMTIKDIRPREDHNQLLAAVARLEQGPAPQQIWKHIKRNGEMVYVDIIGQMIRFKDKEARLILAKDITEKLNADMEILNLNSLLLEQNEKLKEYGHIYSHQIRSPLASIMGLTNLMKGNPSLANAEMLGMMEEACRKLDKEIRKMNDLLIDVEKRSDDVSR